MSLFSEKDIDNIFILSFLIINMSFSSYFILFLQFVFKQVSTSIWNVNFRMFKIIFFNQMFDFKQYHHIYFLLICLFNLLLDFN